MICWRRKSQRLRDEIEKVRNQFRLQNNHIEGSDASRLGLTSKDLFRVDIDYHEPFELWLPCTTREQEVRTTLNSVVIDGQVNVEIFYCSPFTLSDSLSSEKTGFDPI